MPFFLFISDGHYKTAIDELSLLDLDYVRLSDFCGGDDRLPDLDRLFTYIEEAGKNSPSKKFFVTGLGEYLALRGRGETSQTLLRLKDLNVGGAKVVLLLRGLTSQINELQTDPRFDNRRFSADNKPECELSITLLAPSVGLSALSGFKALLMELENGRCGTIVVNTAVNLDNSIITINRISSAYDGITFFTRDFALPRSCGSDALWAELMTELNQNNGSLDKVFDKHGLGNDLESDVYARTVIGDYYSWLYFICLKSRAGILQNGYLRFVLTKTTKFEDFSSNILNVIIEIPHTDQRYSSFYRERKALVEKIPESDIANFVVNNRQVVSESIYKLTDGTKVEREEIIAWISQNGFFPEIGDIYPALAAYQKKYIFKYPDFADLLTEYFEDYKRQKLSNNLEPGFLEKVDQLARNRIFNRLPTRNEIVDSVEKTDTFLYWLDALGVEYLGLIEDLAQRRGLSIRVSIARAELPTTTPFNRDFFDAWQGPKEKNDELDDIKHSDAGGYNFTNNELPIHLAKELEVIAAMMEKAATKLALRQCKRFLVVSDHGASRLAVLQRKIERYDTDTKGEYSGRCCELFHPYNLPFAAEENGYLVLADYGRFKGSRAANVEVHGGASLEEVIIPIIELSLKEGSVMVKLVDEVVIVDYRTGTEINLFFNSPVKGVSVVLNGKAYSALQTDQNHYSVKLPDIKRAGEYPADVYADDNLIGKIEIKAQGKSGKVNDDFDELF
nr:BREX-4 system phosphatase PglZ [Methanocalculus sp. AMF5]